MRVMHSRGARAPPPPPRDGGPGNVTSSITMIRMVMHRDALTATADAAARGPHPALLDGTWRGECIKLCIMTGRYPHVIRA